MITTHPRSARSRSGESNGRARPHDADAQPLSPSGRAQGLLDPDELALACTAPGVPGLVPHPQQSLALVPGWVLGQLDASQRGVIVLGVDGLSWSLAAACWHAAELACLTSTFPTTSATAWLTALTGVGPAEHLAAANSYLVPALGTVVDAVTAQPITWPGQAALPLEASTDAQLVAPQHPTLFERARQQGVTCVAVTREFDGLPGPWTDALLRGADRWDRGKTSASALQAQAADPPSLATAVIGDVEQVLAEHPGDALVWAYVNLDDYAHLHGYDGAAEQALAALETAATRWAGQGWTVIAHADHGQVRRVRDQGLEAVWAAVDTPALCAFPGAGAGRTRWLYPRPGKAAEVAERLRQGLGPNALVLSASELVDLGLVSDAPRLLERVGEVVALARTEHFPLEDPDMLCEHGGVGPDEMLVPLATWPRPDLTPWSGSAADIEHNSLPMTTLRGHSDQQFDPPRSVLDTSAESLAKGDRVIVVGRLKTRSWETPEGEKRSVTEIDADEVAPSLRWATAKPQRTSPSASAGGGSQAKPTGQFNNEPPF